MAVKIDLTGKEFGNLEVIRLAVDIPGEKKKWLCRCKKCGNEVVIQGGNLTNGHSTQCKTCQFKEAQENHKSHGMTGTKLYNVWNGMINRCENTTYKSYHDYGERGISVCEEWHTPKNFFDWALSNGYKEGLEIDRIDVNGNYEPSNCRWVERIVNANNKRNSHYITHNGEIKTIAEWARYYGVSYKYIHKFINEGYSLEKAVERYRKHKAKTVKGVTNFAGKYQARITVDKKVYCLGTFDTFDEAKEARKQAELKYWGHSDIV